jgi:hypothetical protein
MLTMSLASHSLGSVTTDIGSLSAFSSTTGVRSSLDLTPESSTDDVLTKSNVYLMNFASNVAAGLVRLIT